MAADRFTFSEQDCQRIKSMLLAFERGEMNARPRYRRKDMPWRYPSSSAYFTRIGASTPVAGRSGTTTPFTVSQDTLGSNYGLNSSNQLDQITGDTDPYNYSKLPAIPGRLTPIMTDSAGTPFMMPLWTNFCIQCIGVHAYNGSGLSIGFDGRVTLSSWLGPNGAVTYDDTLWYNLNTNEIELKVDGDYLIWAGASFQCAATAAAYQAGFLTVGDNNNSALSSQSVANVSWSSDAGNITYQNSSVTTLWERNSSTSTQAVTLNLGVSGSAIATRAWMVIMPVGFGETI